MLDFDDPEVRIAVDGALQQLVGLALGHRAGVEADGPTDDAVKVAALLQYLTAGPVPVEFQHHGAAVGIATMDQDGRNGGIAAPANSRRYPNMGWDTIIGQGHGDSAGLFAEHPGKNSVDVGGVGVEGEQLAQCRGIEMPGDGGVAG